VSVNRVALTTKSINRRNFKALERPALLRALDSWPWSDVLQIRDPDKVLDFVTRGIVHGLDQAAPKKAITVKEGSLPLYLRPDTLALMAKRDSLGRGPRYKAARNKEMSNLSKLSESGNSPTVLWEIANAAVGKPHQPLPASVKKADGTHTEGNLRAANMVNTYVEKVRKIRAGRGVQNSTIEGATKPMDGDTGRKIPSTFSFNFATAGRIAKVIAVPGSRPPPRSAPMGSGGRAQDGVRCVGRAHLPPGQHVLVGRRVPVGLQDGPHPPCLQGGRKSEEQPRVVQARGLMTRQSGSWQRTLRRPTGSCSVWSTSW
jgi:hypothetical protein